jgi:hypothetical protein
MHLSLKGSLKSSLTFTYVKTDQALDLGNLEPFTIPDLSDNANTATLYSGIYVSTNGTIDKAIGANATALGSGNYYLSGKIKPAGTTAKTTMDGSTASNLTGLTAGVWQDFQTATASAITPSSINLGWDGTAFNATVDNWSDVKLHDASDDSVVAHYKLYDSADASLDGYPALDCVGGFHGAHVGCAGGSGEGVDADVAGISATLDDKMWFDGVNDYVSYNTGSTVSSHFGSCTMSAYIIFNDLSSTQSIWSHGASGNRIYMNSGNIRCNADTTTLFNPSAGILYLIEADFNASGELTEFRVDGNVEYSGPPISAGLISSQPNFYLGTRASNDNNTGIYFNGIIYGFTVSGSNGLEWIGNGNTDAAWVDQIGSNNGTVNGNPVTVGQKRETILQTAGEDFNKRMWFDGANDNVYRSVANFRSGDSSGRIKVSFFFSSNGSTQSIFSTSDESSAGSYIWLALTTSGNVVINVISGGTTETITSDDPVPVGWNTLEFSSSGSSWTLLANGASLSFTMTNGTNSGRWFSGVNLRDNISVGLLVRNTSIFPFEGIISNLEIYDASNDLVFHWLGNGNTNADWTDQIGSNNGTVNGSPSLYHVAESETTAGIDALGTAITNPRPNERVLNLTTGTGYAEIAESASLDLTTAATWELWGNFYELFSSSESLLSKWSSSVTAKRSWIVNGNNGAELNRVRLAISANGSTVSWIGYVEVPDSVISLIFTYNGTIVTGYVNGASVTVTTTFGSIPASMHVGTAPLSIGTDNDSGTMLLRQIGDIRIYNRALTADEVLKNYNARKGAYGL